MSGEPPSHMPWRKICVPRRRCARDKGTARGQNSQQPVKLKGTAAVGPAMPVNAVSDIREPHSFNFAPVIKTDSEESNALGSFGGCEFKAGQVSQPAALVQLDLPSDTGNVTTNALDLSNATDAFSKVSLQEKPARYRTLLPLLCQTVMTFIFSNTLNKH